MPANRWGLIPSPPDPRNYDIRDHVQFTVTAAPKGLPNRINYMKNQVQFGSCTAFMRERLQRMALQHAGLPDIDLSPLHAYWWNRFYSGLPTDQDVGASISGTMKAGREKGICREAYWTYANANGYINVKPEYYADDDALNYQILETYQVPNNPNDIINALANGFGVGLGSAVHYNAYEMNFINSGVIQMPQNNDPIAGYHAYVLDGWDTTIEAGRFNIAGSWGEVSPLKGFGTIPFDYITKYGFDIWAVKANESPTPSPTNHIAHVTLQDGQTLTHEFIQSITVDNRQVFP